jgi:hypothetical protein
MIRRSLDAADRHQRLSKYVRWRVPIPFSLWATPDCLDGLTAVPAVYGQHTRQRCIPSTAVRREDLERRSRAYRSKLLLGAEIRNQEAVLFMTRSPHSQFCISCFPEILA